MENGKDGGKEKPKKPKSNTDITRILNEILDTSIEPLPSTSKDQKPQESNVPTPTPNSQRSVEGNQESLHFETCTVKEILSEILDCTVVRPPILQPQPLQRVDRTIVDPSRVVPEYVFEPKVVPRQPFNPRCNSDESSCSRMQYTVKEALNEMWDFSILKKSIQSGSCRPPPPGTDLNGQGTSHTRPEYLSQGEIGGNQRDYQVYRAIGTGMIKSASALQSPSAISMSKLLPSYSTVLKLGPPPKIKSFESSGSFIPRQPPPSYAEVEGLWEDNPSLISSESAVFGPDPTYVVCPRCRAVVVTDVHTERSNMTHIIALVMCVCLCWPCCLLPYCLRSCNYTYHSCPNCRHYFGMYRPF